MTQIFTAVLFNAELFIPKLCWLCCLSSARVQRTHLIDDNKYEARIKMRCHRMATCVQVSITFFVISVRSYLYCDNRQITCRLLNECNVGINKHVMDGGWSTRQRTAMTIQFNSIQSCPRWHVNTVHKHNVWMNAWQNIWSKSILRAFAFRFFHSEFISNQFWYALTFFTC